MMYTILKSRPAKKNILYNHTQTGFTGLKNMPVDGSNYCDLCTWAEPWVYDSYTIVRHP